MTTTAGGLSRREWARLAALGAAGVVAGGCALRSAAPRGYTRPLSTRPFARPRVARAIHTRTIVGLRPFRPSGFVVRAERIGAKVLVHNYGHGGAGITLSWGSSALAVREAPAGDRRAAVLGAGIMGLTTARLLQDRGWTVTIHAKALPPHTTSNVAGGQFSPTSVFDPGATTAAFDAQVREAARLSHHALAGLVGAGYGVSWRENYELADRPSPLSWYLRDLPDLFPSAATLVPHEHPFPAVHVVRYVTLLVEPAIFLNRVMADVRAAGGRVVVHELRDRADVLALDEPVVFNCTGLGAAALFGDAELVPVRGQLEFLPPDDRLDYLTVGGGAGLLYMFPRSDGVLLGGTFERGQSDLRPDAATTTRILDGHARLAAAMRI